MTSRAERVRRSVLEATVDILSDVGVERTTIDEVAERSGVAKTTIYRHWPSKQALVAEAVHGCLDLPVVPDTGHLRSDLLACFDSMIRKSLDGRMGTMMLSLLDSAQRDPELDRILNGYLDQRRRPVRVVLERAVARGELPEGTDVDLLVTMLSGPLVYTKLVLRRPLTRALVERVVDGVLGGAESGAVVSARRPARV
jgi:AcrR family transcriptional regulator